MEAFVSTKDLQALSPEMVVFVWAGLLLLIDQIWIREKGKTAFLAALGSLVALGLALRQLGLAPAVAFQGMIVTDPFAALLAALFALSGLLGILLARDFLARNGLERGTYYVLLLFAIGGMMLMARVADLIMLFLALELFSIPLYVLSGFARPRTDSEEAALKYFLLGAFAAGFMVFGIALVYGATGDTRLAVIMDGVKQKRVDFALLTSGAVLLLVGLGFKVAAVPFHMWTPDVYQGAPSPVTGFMAVTAKAAGFAALLRLFTLVFGPLTGLVPIWWALAALTMILGNVVAIAQWNIKRMLAYSSIAHAGYMLMAAVAFPRAGMAAQAVAAVLFYLLAYALATLGAWGVVVLLERRLGEGVTLDAYAGLAHRAPGLAAAMTVFMLSYIGVPPTLGFFGKFYLFKVALDAGYVDLALIGVLTSLVSAYYYLRVVMWMYMRPGTPEVRREPGLQTVIALLALVTLFLGLAVASPFFQWAAGSLFHLS